MVSLIVARNRAAERAAMQAPRAALRKALEDIDLGTETLLERADAGVALAPRKAQIAWWDVNIFIRIHPDIAMWSPGLIQSVKPDADVDLVVDAIFRLAAAIDELRDGAAERAAVRALLDLPEEA